MRRRDVALVLSGGGMSGIMLELGFLQRVCESELWERVGWIYGTSAGALSGCMAALDRLDDLEQFLLGLEPEDTFRANRLWRLPLLGTHDYVLPRTVAKRIGNPVQLARALAAADRELVVIVTDVTPSAEDGRADDPLFERAYSSKSTAPEEMAQAVFASAAISALVLPVPVGDRVGTDGAWVRNYPLGYAYGEPAVELIVGFRYEPRYSVLGAEPLRALARKLQRYAKLPPARAILAEVEGAVAREERGLPAHIVDTFSRLSRVAIIRNTELEEMVATWREESVRELQLLRDDVHALVQHSGDDELSRAVDERFADARFPFRHDRFVPRITVTAAAADLTLEPGFRNPQPWTVEAKRELQQRGYDAADAALRGHGFS